MKQKTKDKKILIVEDDPFILEMYKNKLEKVGFKISVAKSGKEGIIFLEKDAEVDLILLDVVMPGMNGFEMLEIIKADEEYKKIPVILLTNLSQQEDIEKGLKLGATDYLIKAHFTPSEVVEKVKKIQGKIL